MVSSIKVCLNKIKCKCFNTSNYCEQCEVEYCTKCNKEHNKHKSIIIKEYYHKIESTLVKKLKTKIDYKILCNVPENYRKTVSNELSLLYQLILDSFKSSVATQSMGIIKNTIFIAKTKVDTIPIEKTIINHVYYFKPLFFDAYLMKNLNNQELKFLNEVTRTFVRQTKKGLLVCTDGVQHDIFNLNYELITSIKDSNFTFFELSNGNYFIGNFLHGAIWKITKKSSTILKLFKFKQTPYYIEGTNELGYYRYYEKAVLFSDTIIIFYDRDECCVCDLTKQTLTFYKQFESTINTIIIHNNNLIVCFDSIIEFIEFKTNRNIFQYMLPEYLKFRGYLLFFNELFIASAHFYDSQLLFFNINNNYELKDTISYNEERYYDYMTPLNDKLIYCEQTKSGYLSLFDITTKTFIVELRIPYTLFSFNPIKIITRSGLLVYISDDRYLMIFDL